jgi:diguanylate cyclase (GGDEF)-like protein
MNRPGVSTPPQKNLADEIAVVPQNRIFNTIADLNLAIAGVPIGIYVVDAQTHQILSINSVALEMTGFPNAEFCIGRPCQMFLCPTTPGNCPVMDRGEDVCSCEHVLMTANGGRLPVFRTVGKAVVDGRLVLIETFMDFSARKEDEQSLLQQAMYDRLTGLPNRTLFLDRLHRLIKRSRRSPNTKFAILFLDLDRFKVINDSLGHSIGDELLIAVAKRLESALRAGDSVSRLGGDEFTILIDEVQNADEAVHISERACRALEHPFNLGGHEVFTSASIGIVISGGGLDKAEDLIQRADTAMYRAKALGKGRYVLFDQAMHERAVALHQLEVDLRHAIGTCEFLTHYQPIVHLKSNRIVGFEALVRWENAKRGSVPPNEFLPLAEEVGLLSRIGEHVLNQACNDVAHWQQLYPSEPPLAISVNVSASQIRQKDLAESIENAIQSSHIARGSLRLEVRESELMENAETVVALIERLKPMDVQIEVDGFGAGVSSLRQLRTLSIHCFKIDLSIIREMGKENDTTEIVRTILTLAHNLNRPVVAEGIEEELQREMLIELGCEYGQGYLFSRPLEPSQITGLLTERQKT